MQFKVAIYFIILIPLTNTNGQNLYTPTKLSTDTMDLFIGDGDINADTVLIICEGGPKYHLGFESNGRTYWEYLRRHNNYYFAIPHQASTYNRGMLACTDFNVEAASYESDISSEIMARVIGYFKNSNHYVVVFAHSYGAFVALDYLSKYENIADKYFLTAGRIVPDSVQVAYQYQGINVGYKADAKTLDLADVDEKPSSNRRSRYHTIRRNIQWLKYPLGKKSFMDKLSNKNLSNVFFFFGTNDINVGSLQNSEVEFLERQGAQVLALEADHYSLWKRVIDAFDDGLIKL